MKKLLYVLLFLFLVNISLYSQCLKLDIILLADVSGSLHGSEHLVESALVGFVDRFELTDETVRIGLVTFGTYSFVNQSLTADKSMLFGAISIFNKFPLGGYTNISSGLAYAYHELITNGRFDVPKIIILISDGVQTHDMNKLPFIVANIQNDPNGMTICGVYIETGGSSPVTMQSITNSGCYATSNYKDLEKTLLDMSICM